MSPILGIWASQISGHLFGPSSAYESIATTTVGAGGASSITFSSIPSTYTHLQIRYFGRDNRSGASANNILTTFNSDTGNNYSQHLLEGDGSTAASYASTSQANFKWLIEPSSLTTSNVFAGGIVDILDYANTSKYKTTRALLGFDANGTGLIDFFSGVWMSTSAITSITFAPTSGSFVQYSNFALYGIRGN